jgi:hypothetical protein
VVPRGDRNLFQAGVGPFAEGDREPFQQSTRNDDQA